MKRQWMLVLTLALGLMSGAAAAQGLRFDPGRTAACLETGGGRDCIGVAANACMAATEGGYSTVGMVDCLSAEHEWWDADLNARYQELRARERADDAAWQPIPGLAPRLSGADAIRDVQRAWIAFRDVTCVYQELQWWGGTGALISGAACRMQMTAEQALVLRGYLPDG